MRWIWSSPTTLFRSTPAYRRCVECSSSAAHDRVEHESLVATNAESHQSPDLSLTISAEGGWCQKSTDRRGPNRVGRTRRYFFDDPDFGPLRRPGSVQLGTARAT